MIKRLTIASLAAALVMALAVPAALAASGWPDEIVVGNDYTLKEGETLNGNLVVYGGSATLEAGSVVTGDVVVFGGDVEASGEIRGDAVVVGGNAALKETAVVDGDLVTVGGNIHRDPGAQVKGQEVTTSGPDWNFGRWLARPPLIRFADFVDFGVGSLFRIAGWSLTMGVLALLVLLFWPDQTARAAQAIVNAPLPAFGLGLLTAIVGGLVFTVLVLALCLGLIGWVGLTAATLFGWIALGSLVGARLAPALRLTDTHPAVSGALGTFLLTVVVEAVRIIPCLGDIAALILASVALGAVVLTRFGTRAYLPAMPAPPVAA